jgi:hypothetical protein
MSASFLGRKLFGGAATQATAGGSPIGSSSGGLNGFARQYYAKYIQTSSVKPILHVMAVYIGAHWSITYWHKHKYQANNRFH